MNLLLFFIDQSYESLSDLISTINARVTTQDYAEMIKRIKKNIKDFVKKTWIICDKSRRERNEKYKKRQTSSRKTDWSFEIVVVLNTNRDFWTYKITISDHNHDFILTNAHSVHRKAVMIKKIKSIIVDSSKHSPRSIQISKIFYSQFVWMQIQKIHFSKLAMSIISDRTCVKKQWILIHQFNHWCASWSSERTDSWPQVFHLSIEWNVFFFCKNLFSRYHEVEFESLFTKLHL